MKDYIVRLWADIDGDHASVRTDQPHDLSYFRNFLDLGEFLEALSTAPSDQAIGWLEPSRTYSADSLQPRPRHYLHYRYQKISQARSQQDHSPQHKTQHDVQSEVDNSLDVNVPSKQDIHTNKNINNILNNEDL